MNVIILTGNIGKDPEIIEASVKIAKFSVATQDYFNKEKQTTWHTCKAFGKTAELIEQYCEKGSKVGITGRMSYPTWTKDGEKKYGVEIIVSSIEFLSGKEEAPKKVVTEDDEPTDLPF